MQLLATTEADTEAAGARLARALPAPLPMALQVRLHGDLGAGKTTFVRGFLRELGHAGAVRSPTYTLVETYTVGAVTVVHADLYRLQDPEEFAALGLRDLDLPGHVWLVEWPQRGGRWLPAADLDVSLSAQPDAHRIDLRAATVPGAQWLAHIQS